MDVHLAEYWRQGKYISCSDLPPNLKKLIEEAIPCAKKGKAIKDSSLIVLISQDCDIAARNDLEPWLQFVIADKVKNPHELNYSVRSTRKLVLNDKYNAHNYELKIQKMSFVEKTSIEEAQLDSSKIKSLSTTDIKLLKRWLTRRYNRTALPHNFNVKTSRLLREFKNLPVDLYLRLDSYDDGRNNYAVAVVAVPYPSCGEIDFPSIKRYLNKFIEDLDKVEGLRFDQDWLDENYGTLFMERSEMNLDLLDKLNLWNLDYISFNDNDFEASPD